MLVSLVLGGCLSADWIIYCTHQKNCRTNSLKTALCFKYLCRYACEHVDVWEWSLHTLSSFGISVKRAWHLFTKWSNLSWHLHTLTCNHLCINENIFFKYFERKASSLNHNWHFNLNSPPWKEFAVKICH